MPVTYDQPVTIHNRPAVQGSTYLRALWGSQRDASLPPVIDLHGWPLSFPWDPAVAWDFRKRALLAAGYTIIQPWCGANWGHPTNVSPAASGPAGRGLAAITDARTYAGTLGLPTTRVHLYGDSMGGLNALAWALANPTRVAGLWADQPVTSLGYMWDLGTFYRASIESAWGTTGRANVLAAASAADPVQNYAGLQALAGRIAFFASRQDTVVGWTTTVEMLSTAVPLTLTPTTPEGESGLDHGNHTTSTNWDEFAVLRHFEANET